MRERERESERECERERERPTDGHDDPVSPHQISHAHTGFFAQLTTPETISFSP